MRIKRKRYLKDTSVTILFYLLLPTKLISHMETGKKYKNKKNKRQFERTKNKRCNRRKYKFPKEKRKYLSVQIYKTVGMCFYVIYYENDSFSNIMCIVALSVSSVVFCLFFFLEHNSILWLCYMPRHGYIVFFLFLLFYVMPIAYCLSDNKKWFYYHPYPHIQMKRKECVE